MMNNCEIVQDLLPLYIDDVVSASTIAMIEEHIKTCETCKGELTKLQGDVEVSFEPAQKEEIGALRLFRRKILRKNVIIAFSSVVLAAAFLLGTYLYLDSDLTPIPYRDGLVIGIEADPDRGVIDIVSSINPARKDAVSINIIENDEIVRLVFVGFSESTISKWQNNNDQNFVYTFRAVYQMTASQPDSEGKPGVNYNDEPFDRCELYYIDDLSEINAERDYQELRHNGELLFSGEFADKNLTANQSYGLENATEQQFAERMTHFSLYKNGTMSFAIPPISSYIPPHCTYSVEGDEMVFRAIIKTEHEKGFFGLENGDVVARFLIEDENTLIFLSAEVALFAEPNGRYILVYPDVP